MKILLYGLVAFLSFAIFLAIPLALTGNLTPEALQRAVSRQPDLTLPAEPAPEPTGPLTQYLKKKEEELKRREQELRQRQAQLEQRESEFDQLRSNLESIQQDLYASLEGTEADRLLGFETIAITIAEMKPQKAAESIRALPIEDQAQILAKVKPKDRGKIVEAMPPEDAARVLSAIQQQAVL
jgi:flagellar motility protein MotE (MotC chaperone)